MHTEKSFTTCYMVFLLAESVKNVSKSVKKNVSDENNNLKIIKILMQ